MKPEVVNHYKVPGWESDSQYVYIGRKGKGRDGYFGNPYTGEEAIEKFLLYAYKKVGKDPEYRRRVRELWGKKIVCFCSPKPCHGDVLAQLCEELNAMLPCQDGRDHINVYSKGETWLGKQLSNFARGTVRTEDGKFLSVEAYWYWLTVPDDEPRRKELRRVAGYEAKRLGRELRGQDWVETREFRRKIRYAIWQKISTCPKLARALRDSELPLVHYYAYGDGPSKKIVVPEDGRWILRFIEKCRQHLKDNPRALFDNEEDYD